MADKKATEKDLNQDNQDNNINLEQFAGNMVKAASSSFDIFSKVMADENSHMFSQNLFSSSNSLPNTFLQVFNGWMGNPNKMFEAQMHLWQNQFKLWNNMVDRVIKGDTESAFVPEKGDRRFNSDAWQENMIFNFFKQSYLLTSRWAEQIIDDSENLDEKTKKRAEFYLNQLSNALSPSNFLLTNPNALKVTFDSNGENLVKGLENLKKDLEGSDGHFQISQTTKENFEVGKNLATTEGKVVFQNELFQLIQYTPTTKQVNKTPLLIIPPWINKYYILDLNEKKSFVKWAVDNGLSVFIISWVNPDDKHLNTTLEDYMNDGIFKAIEVVLDITKEKDLHSIGYCIGGTLLSMGLAYMAVKKDKRVKSATLFTAQTDFTHAGDLKIFTDQEQIDHFKEELKEVGIFNGKKMAHAFNMLRANDLIWSYVENNYLLGRDPMPFDFLYWNSDSTNIPGPTHIEYLEECYINNSLSQKKWKFAGINLDLGKIKTPIYTIATREDHIAPPESVYLGSKLYGGEVTFVLAGSGHIAGIVNHPSRNKYQYWLKKGNKEDNYIDWLEDAEEHSGSWWPAWREWLNTLSSEEIPALKFNSKKYKPIENAPGSYVKKTI